MTPEEAVNIVRTVAEAVAWNIAVWHRGGKGTKTGKVQERAFAAAFEALTGRKPTAEEMKSMGGSGVFGGL